MPPKVIVIVKEVTEVTVESAEHQIFDAAGNVIEDAIDELKAKVRNAACSGLDGTCIIELLHSSSDRTSTDTSGRRHRKLQGSPSVDVSITREYDFGNSSTNVSAGVADLLESEGIPVAASEMISLSASSTLTANGLASDSLMASPLYTDALRNELSTMLPQLQASITIVSSVVQPPALPPLMPPSLSPQQPPSPEPMGEEASSRSNVQEAPTGASSGDYVTFAIVGGVLLLLLLGAILMRAIFCRGASGKWSFGTHRHMPKSSLQAAESNGTRDELYGILPGATKLAESADAPALAWSQDPFPSRRRITFEDPHQVSPIKSWAAEKDMQVVNLSEQDFVLEALNDPSAPDETRPISLTKGQQRNIAKSAGAAIDSIVPPRVLLPPPARPPPARPPPAMAHLESAADQRWAQYQRKSQMRRAPVLPQRFGTAVQVLPTSTKASDHHAHHTWPDAESTTAASSTTRQVQSSQDKSDDAESTTSVSSTTSTHGAISLFYSNGT